MDYQSLFLYLAAGDRSSGIDAGCRKFPKAMIRAGRAIEKEWRRISHTAVFFFYL